MQTQTVFSFMFFYLHGFKAESFLFQRSIILRLEKILNYETTNKIDSLKNIPVQSAYRTASLYVFFYQFFNSLFKTAYIYIDETLDFFSEFFFVSVEEFSEKNRRKQNFYLVDQRTELFTTNLLN